MRLVEFALNCIKETVRNDDSILSEENILNGELLNNPNYATEIRNVLLSVNKGIARLTQCEKIPFRKVAIDTKQTTYEYELDVIDLQNKHLGIKNIKQVYYLIDGVIIPIEYNLIGRTLYLPRPLNGKLTIVYSPYIKAFRDDELINEKMRMGDVIINLNERDTSPDLESLGIDDEMCTILQYFAKSELYEDRDADRSKRYLNYFESFLNDFKKQQILPYQRGVEHVNSMGFGYEDYGYNDFPYRASIVQSKDNDNE